MPSSDYNSISKVLQVVEKLRPASILDVGCGNGRYGFLFRELLDLNYGRLCKSEWMTVIDAVEVESDYIGPIHSYVYDYLFLADWLKADTSRNYDLLFMGDVLEHFGDGDWQQALAKAKRSAAITLVVCPNHKDSINQGSWHGHESERHRTVLSPSEIGGRCLYANSKTFMVGFDNCGSGILSRKDCCL